MPQQRQITENLQQTATEAKLATKLQQRKSADRLLPATCGARQLKNHLLNRMKDSSSQQGVGGVRIPTLNRALIEP
jgi:hypothetical protein